MFYANFVFSFFFFKGSSKCGFSTLLSCSGFIICSLIGSCIFIWTNKDEMRWVTLPRPLATHSATRRDSFIDFGAIYYLLTYLPTNRTHLQYVARITVSCRPSSWIDRETGRQQSAVRRTSGSLLQRYMGNSLWWLLWWHRRQSRLLQSRLRVSQLLCRWITKYLAVANRSRVSCAQNTSRTSTGLITQSPWNLLKIIGKRNHWIDHNTTYC